MAYKSNGYTVQCLRKEQNNPTEAHIYIYRAVVSNTTRKMKTI